MQAQADHVRPRRLEVRARAVTRVLSAAPDAWIALRARGDLMAEASRAADGDGRLVLVLDGEELGRWGPGEELEVPLEVGARGLATRVVRGRVLNGEEVVELGTIVLEAGASVVGRVVDQRGRPLSGALVAFGEPIFPIADEPRQRHDGPRALESQGEAERERVVLTRSAGDGSFVLAGLPVGHGSVWARTEVSFWHHSEPIGLAAGQDVRGVELVLVQRPTSFLSGQVVDPGGRAVPGAELLVRAAGTPSGGVRVQADDRGRFRAACDDGKPRDIEAGSPWFGWDDAIVRGVASGTHDVLVRFETSRWLSVVVEGADGRPLESGRVVALAGAATPLPFSPGPRPSAPRTDPWLDGEGRARVQRTDGPFRLRVTAPGHREQQLGPFMAESFPNPLVVRLEAVPSITGRVLLPGGAPAVGATVVLPPDGAERLEPSDWNGAGEPFVLSLRPTGASTLTDSAGRFRLALPGSSSPAREPGPTTTLSGLGYGASPAPPAHPNSAGEEPGFVIVGSYPGRAAPAVGVQVAQEQELELILPASGSVAGRLEVADGSSPLGWSVQACDGEAGFVSVPVAGDGTFRFEILRPGPWQLRAFEPGARFDARASLKPTPREPRIDIEVQADETLALVLQADRRPRLRLLGQLTVDSAPPGPWVVELFAEGSTRTPRASGSVDPAGRFELELPWRRHLRLDLRQPFGATPHTWIVERLEAEPGELAWNFDLPTATLAGRVDLGRILGEEDGFHGPSRTELRHQLEHGSLQVRTTLLLKGSRLPPHSVPAGMAELRTSPNFMYGEAELLGTVDIAPGASLEIDLP